MREDEVNEFKSPFQFQITYSNFIKMTVMCMILGYIWVQTPSSGEILISLSVIPLPIRQGWESPGLKGRNAAGISVLPGRRPFGQRTRLDCGHRGLGFNTPIRNAVSSCLVLSNRPKHRRVRKSDPLRSVCTMLAVGPVGACNLHIHMTSQAENSLVLQCRLHRAYINSG